MCVYFKPTIPEDIVDDYTDRISNLLDDERIGPELRVQDFDDYMPLINGEELALIEQFLAEEHTFDEYIEAILALKEETENIPIKMEHIVKIGMYDMKRPELIKTLVAAGESYTEMLLDRCTHVGQSLCKTYVYIIKF